MPGAPARILGPNAGSLSSEAIHKDVLKEWSPLVSGFRDASTDAPAKASTPGARSLTGLFRLAKR
jgi:hypothetical protein